MLVYLVVNTFFYAYFCFFQVPCEKCLPFWSFVQWLEVCCREGLLLLECLWLVSSVWPIQLGICSHRLLKPQAVMVVRCARAFSNAAGFVMWH